MLMPQEFYPLTLVSIITVISFSTFVAITTIYKTGCSSSISSTTFKAFQLYFLYGILGWTIYGVVDFLNYPIALSWLAISYFFASAIFLFMLTEDTAINLKNTLWAVSHLGFSIAEIFSESLEEQLWVFALYILTHMSILAYIANKRRKQIDNIGYTILSLATVIPLVLAVDQVYLLLNDYDLKIAVGLGVLGAAISYSLVGLGFMTMLLVIQRNAFLAQSHIDPLTGIYNRRGFDNALQHLLASSRREKSEVCVVMCDIDHFKRINDLYGHKSGDIVLKSFADLLEKEKRESDLIARFGGEEFIYFLPKTGFQEAEIFAERVRQKVEKMDLVLNKDALKLTASFGVASQHGEIDMDSLIQAADKALYEAKSHGRNQVSLHDLKNQEIFF